MPASLTTSRKTSIAGHAKEGKVLGKGAFGVVREWAKNKVIKVEQCDKIEYKRQGFSKDVDERVKLTQRLVRAGLTGKTLEHFQFENECITVMDKIPGETMEKVLGNVSGEEAERLIRNAAHAISRMQKLVPYSHGDLHTGNVMVTPSGKIKFIDFAFERRLDKSYDWTFFFGSAWKHINKQKLSKEKFIELVNELVPKQYVKLVLQEVN